MKGLKRFAAKAIVLLLILGVAFIYRGQFNKVEKTKAAGKLSNVTWTLGDSTANATTTYTHSFVTETAIPANSGSVNIMINLPPGPPSPLPDFSGATIDAAGTSPNSLDSATPQVWGSQYSTSIAVFGTAEIAAGSTVTIKFANVKNPSGGVYGTTTVTTGNYGNSLDGSYNMPNGKIGVGSPSITGKITAGGVGIKNIMLEVHGDFKNGAMTNGMWQTFTDENGDYTFYGIPNGSYILEMRNNMSPGSEATAANEYLAFDPEDITLSGSPITKNKIVAKSTKIIKGKVKYSNNSAAVFGANVNAFSMGPGGQAFTQTDASGNFTLRVGGGNYFVQVMPSFGPPPGQGGPGGQPAPAQDFFPQPSRQVSFVSTDASIAETIDMGDVLVDKSDATVTGRLLTPSGTPLSGTGGGGMGAMNPQTHTFIPVNLGSDGTFSMSAKSGTGKWELNRFDPNAQYALPEVTFTIKPGTNSLGDIKMVALDKTVTVTAKRQDSGAGIANIPVMVFNTKKMGPPYMGFTGTSGSTLGVAAVKVPAGFEGRVMVNPGGSGGPGKREGEKGGGPGGGPMGWLRSIIMVAQAQQQPTKSFESDAAQLFPVTPPQKVKAGDSVTMIFAKADKRVSVITMEKGTSTLVTDGGYINARPAGSSGFEGFGGGFGGSSAGGQGTVYTTAGDFQFNTFFPPDSEYVGLPKKVTVSGDTSVTLESAKKTVTITGKVLDASNGNAVIKDSTLNIMIGIFSNGAFSMGKYNPSDGTYTAKFAPEIKFRVGVAAGDPGMGVKNGGYIPNMNPKELSAKDGETLTQDLTLAKVDAVLTGTVKDQNGKAVEGVTVFADPGLANIVGPEGEAGPGGPEAGPEFGFSGVTDENGKYTINVAPNKYNLAVNAREKGLFTTGTTQVTIASKETKTTDLNLAKADSSINVTVDNQNGQDLADAQVQIYNDKGTIAFNSAVDDQGKVKIDIPAGEYTIKAGKDSSESGTVEQTAFKKITTKKDETTTLALQTTTEANALAKPITQDVSETNPTALVLSNAGNEEASLEIPAGAISSSSSQDSSGGSSSGSSSSPIVAVSPLKAQAVATKADIPVKGISISATDTSGNQVTTLSGMVTGKIAYKEGDLPSGTDESKLEIKSFNENSGQWEKVSVSAVDTTNNVVTFATTHFSDFAIVTTSSTTTASTATATTASTLPATGTDKDNSRTTTLIGILAGIFVAFSTGFYLKRKRSLR